MRQHPDEGTLQAYLDGEIVSEPREALDRHLESCAECRARLRELDRLAGRAADALDEVGRGRSPADLDAARAATRREHARRAAPRRRRRLAAAASVVLLLAAGALAAMPGSPFRGWLGDLFDADAPSPLPAPTAAPAPDRESNDEVSMEVPILDDAFRVSVVGAGPGSTLIVEPVEVPPGIVRAPTGARFESAQGRLRVDLAGAPGVVRVELPTSLREAVVESEGAVLVRAGGGEVAFPGATPDRDDEGAYRFRLEGGTEGRSEG